MSSLKFIIDSSDDDQDPKTDKRAGANKKPGDPYPSGISLHDPSRLAPSSHDKEDNPGDRLSPASARRRGPSTHFSKSTTTPSSSSSSSARPVPPRRLSSESNEPQDPAGVRGSDQGASSSSMPPAGRPNQPMRPMRDAAGEGSIPVKFTPITGRVSRAKKGIPVHVCDSCRKTFTRAEHLRRHQLSHGPAEHRCNIPGCDKSFHRPDLLARHLQRHNDPDDRSSGRGTSDGASRRQSEASLDEGAPGLGFIPQSTVSSGSVNRSTPMNTQSDVTTHSTYSGGTPFSQPISQEGSGAGYPPMSPPSNPGRRDSYRPASAGPSDGAGYGWSNHQSQSMDSSDLTGLIANDGSPWASSASESNYSTTPSEIGHRSNTTRAFRSPTSDWTGPGVYQLGAPHGIHSPGGGLDMVSTTAPYFLGQYSPSPQHPAYDQHMMDLHMVFSEENNTFLDAQTQTYSSVRSPTPPTITLSAQPAETLVSLAAPPAPDAPAVLSRQKDSAAVLGPYSDATFLSAITLSRPIRHAIPEYLDVYWKRFDTLFPLVHSRSMENAADEVLRCAMAAVGTQFLQGREDRFRGNTLHEFAWQEAKRYTQWNVSIMQAILLCEFYARFRGRRVQIRSSQPFQSLYSRVVAPQMPDNRLPPAATSEERWNRWIDAESRRRLLASCFVLDVHTSVYQQQPLLNPYATPTPAIPLTKPTENLWNARTPESWETLLARVSTNPQPAYLSEEILTPDRILTAPPLDRAVFLASEALRLPRRPGITVSDLSADVDLGVAERITTLFPESPIAYAYVALHFTPLHDLLAVSGDSWLFTQKVLTSQDFTTHKKQLKLWSASGRAGAAAGFAAKALLVFLDLDNDNNTPTKKDFEEEERRGRCWNMSDISDYWAMYACALVCWAISHRVTRGTATMTTTTAVAGSSSSSSPAPRDAAAPRRHDGEKVEREARGWLKMVAGLTPEEVLNVRGRREVAGVISLVKKRLEDEAAGGKSRLLVDALGVLKKLEEGVNWKWF